MSSIQKQDVELQIIYWPFFKIQQIYYVGNLNVIDTNSKKYLFKYAYKINVDVQKAFTYIESTELKDAIIDSKSANIDQFLKNSVSWPENAHCLCSGSHDLDIQYEHELRHDG